MNKITTLNNQMEADLLKDFLSTNNIPFIIRSYYDSAYDGLFQMQKGWGYIESEEKYKNIILDFLNNLRNNNLNSE